MRNEITTKISFTLKETDIYRIHQSGDLANLDGLDDESLQELPALLKLRNAMYSERFRNHLSVVTGAGPLSGKKTDMAINIYKPGCHLLCHDDVIGSRRVSYILYLTDPDNPWQPQWGGALRLYPTKSCTTDEGKSARVPGPDSSVQIPPAWNQLSFFAVQPGESFHDVEEVFTSGDESVDGTRARIAISGWYHIPQEGESGYEEGLEAKLAKSSSLTQLQTKDEFDEPKPHPVQYAGYWKAPQLPATPKPDPHPEYLTLAEINCLREFISDKYLVPDVVAAICNEFMDSCLIRIDQFLRPRFAEQLRLILLSDAPDLSIGANEIDASRFHKTACPPHKHRYLFWEPEAWRVNNTGDVVSNKKTLDNPVELLLCQFLSGREFRKWLHLATGLVLKTHDLRARRFRRGMDYQLATTYHEEEPRLELCLGITPKSNPEVDATDTQTTTASQEAASDPSESQSQPQSSQQEELDVGGDGKDKFEQENPDVEDEDKDNYEQKETNGDDNEQEEIDAKGEEEDDYEHGGYEQYTAADEDEEDSAAAAQSSNASTTRKPKSKSKSADPAVYQSADDADDDSTLFTMAAGWNRLSLVLRDSNSQRFVKYLSGAARSDRWDIVGEFDVDWEQTDWPSTEEELAMQLEEEEEEDDGKPEDASSEQETSLDEGWGGLSSEDEENEGLVGSQDVGQAASFGRRRK